MNINFVNLLKNNLSKNIPLRKKILITGCSGFIGIHLLQALTILN